jgi:hypothetical protein
MTMLLTVVLSVLKLPTLERRFTLVLLATLGVAMLPLTWEDTRAVWVILAAVLGFSQAFIAERGGASRQQPPHRAAPAAARPRTAGPLTRRTVPGQDEAPDVTA